MTLKTHAMKSLAKRAGTTLLLGMLAVALVACSGSSRVRKPAELATVTNQFEMQQVADRMHRFQDDGDH